MKTNYDKAKTDYKQQNSECRLWEEREKMIILMISECSKLAQRDYKIKHDRGMVIHLELCN